MTVNVVAIDGPVGSGKSTVARALAERLGWSFLDTGAMYRAVTVRAIDDGIAIEDESAVTAIADRAVIDTVPRVVINGVDVEDRIRTDEVNQGVSIVATYQGVRQAMVRQQRSFALRQPHGTVVEGRDITTVVFPDAKLKVFLTASAEERTRRRGDEDAESVLRRDEIDSAREHSPLRHADDATMVDTTAKTVDEVVLEILKCLKPTL
jgi:cytidylate kinase